jgi:hypothetical protein
LPLIRKLVDLLNIFNKEYVAFRPFHILEESEWNIEHIKTLSCPKCNNEIELKFHPEGHTYTVSCKEDGTHLFMTHKIKTPPTGWKSHISQEWLS